MKKYLTKKTETFFGCDFEYTEDIITENEKKPWITDEKEMERLVLDDVRKRFLGSVKSNVKTEYVKKIYQERKILTENPFENTKNIKSKENTKAHIDDDCVSCGWIDENSFFVFSTNNIVDHTSTQTYSLESFENENDIRFIPVMNVVFKRKGELILENTIFETYEKAQKWKKDYQEKGLLKKYIRKISILPVNIKNEQHMKWYNHKMITENDEKELSEKLLKRTKNQK